VAQIKETLERETRPSMRDLRGPAFGLLPIVWVGIGLSVFQQFVGINVIFYYSSVLWQAAGFNESDSLVITVITNVVNVVTTGRAGRRQPVRLRVRDVLGPGGLGAVVLSLLFVLRFVRETKGVELEEMPG
jgi:SP family sugar:H+ symporter-like MFS transporter